MKNLLLPYAYDSTGNLVHIDNAHKGEIYKCPECGEILSLNISKIPEGQKYHRRNHFSHPQGSPDNKCSESFLHRSFKERSVECIREKITDGSVFSFCWQCHECGEYHQGNMLKKARTVCLEYDLGICKPDIALLDADGKVVIVIEVVVTHKPEPEVLEYYKNQRIACLQINVSDFEDCEKIEYKLSHPDNVNLCPTPVCKVCGEKMHKAKMVFVDSSCWNCNQNMNVAMIMVCASTYNIYSPAYFTDEEISIANANGANIQLKYSKQTKESYYANTCMYCNRFIGDHHIHEYYYYPQIKEIDLGYKCYHCVETEKEKKIEKEREMERRLNENLLKDGVKQCPKCGRRLVVRNSNKGYFYGCKNYPNCHYIEDIIIEE